MSTGTAAAAVNWCIVIKTDKVSRMPRRVGIEQVMCHSGKHLAADGIASSAA